MRRVHITFWVLVLVAVVATGGISRALAGPANAIHILVAALSGVVAVVSALLALRIAVVVTRRPPRAD